VSQDYGKEGTLAVLTPQANTTVEPEIWSLLPPGWSLLNARLTSPCATIEERLVDYAEALATTTVNQFANAPLDAIAFACTGASYLIGAEREQQIVEAVESQTNVPCITAARATTSALKTMGAKSIALLSPYPESLNISSVKYWQSQGFTIVDSAGPTLQREASHPIYAMSAEAVYQSYKRLSTGDADAVLMLGTGMPTLKCILRGHRQQLSPALSCNLALTWAATTATPTTNIAEWPAGTHWQQRFHLITGDSADQR
jgi:maleate isomerase